MNNIEKHVTNLSLSRKLKELGVAQNSLFYWSTRWDSEHLHHLSYGLENTPIGDNRPVSAFLASELGEMLPETTTIFNSSEDHLWTVSYRQYPVGFSEKQCDAMAKHLIWLIEQGYLDVKELNKNG